MNPYGVERDFDAFLKTRQKGISIIRGDIEKSLNHYPDNFFDVIILSRTIQELEHPNRIIASMLKKGRRVVVSFLNYGYFKNRFHFFFKGKKPLTEAFSEPWPEQKEIKPLTIADFENFVVKKNLKIVNKVFLRGDWVKKIIIFPNLFAGVAIYHLES